MLYFVNRLLYIEFGDDLHHHFGDWRIQLPFYLTYIIATNNVVCNFWVYIT